MTGLSVSLRLIEKFSFCHKITMVLRVIKWVVYINPMYLECLSETLRLGKVQKY